SSTACPPRAAKVTAALAAGPPAATNWAWAVIFWFGPGGASIRWITSRVARPAKTPRGRWAVTSPRYGVSPAPARHQAEAEAVRRGRSPTVNAMTTTSLITGASSGLGAEYARQLARRGDHLVLVARDASRLEELAAELERAGAGGIELIRADLSSPGGITAVTDRLTDAARPVETLINSAGFGLPLDFVNNDIEDEVRHLRLHDEVPMRLMHAVLPSMLA